MMLADIKSEHGGSLQVNSLSQTPVVYAPDGVAVSQGYRSGIGEQGASLVVNCTLWLCPLVESSSG